MFGIKVKKVEEKRDKYEFSVEVLEKDSSTRHSVVMTKDFYSSLNTSTSPKKVIEKSFQFLLEREKKESILSSFDISIIPNYFPEFNDKVKKF